MCSSNSWAIPPLCTSFIWLIASSLLASTNSISFPMYLVWHDANKNKLGVLLNEIQYLELVGSSPWQWQWLRRGEQWIWKGKWGFGSLMKWEREVENKGGWGARVGTRGTLICTKMHSYLQLEGGWRAAAGAGGEVQRAERGRCRRLPPAPPAEPAGAMGRRGITCRLQSSRTWKAEKRMRRAE